MKKYLLAGALVLACAPAQAGWLDFLKSDPETYPYRDQGPARLRYIAEAVNACLTVDFGGSVPKGDKQLKFCNCRVAALANSMSLRVAKEIDASVELTPAARALIYKADVGCLKSVLGIVAD